MTETPDLDSIESQLDSTVPYYLPKLLRDFRRALDENELA